MPAGPSIDLAAHATGDVVRGGPAWLAIRDRSDVSGVLDRIAPILIMLATLVAFTLPVYYVFQFALQDGAAGIREALQDREFWRVLAATVQITVGAGVIAVLLGTALAWFAHRLPPRMRWLGFVPLVPLVLPQISFVIGYVFLLSPVAGYGNVLLRTLFAPTARQGPFDVYSIPWIILVTGLSLASLVFLFMRSALGQVHQDLLDAAAAAGASPFRTFTTILLPIVRPALVYTSFIVVLLGLGQFAVPLILGSRPGIFVLTSRMYHATAEFPTNYPLASAYGLPILVTGLLFILLQRLLLGRQERFVTVGGRGARASTGNGPVAQTALVVYGLLAVGLPVAALALVSLEPFWSARIRWDRLTLANVQVVLTQPNLVAAITNSFVYALVTVGITLPLGYLCARTIYDRARKPVLSVLQEVIVSLPLGIPAVILGTGFLLAYTASPLRLYGTPWALILVYITIMIPFATRLQLAAMMNLGHDLTDAAAVSGAGLLRRLFTIEVPLMRASLGSAAALIIVLASHEFAASVLVRSQDTQVMGTVLYDLFAFGSYPQTAVMALLTCLVTGAGVLVALVIGGRGVFESTGG